MMDVKHLVKPFLGLDEATPDRESRGDAASVRRAACALTTATLHVHPWHPLHHRVALQGKRMHSFF